jgi:RND superfamily putative drug exporter
MPASAIRRPWTVRVAAWSARHRWLVAGLWFVATVGVFALSLAAGGTAAREAVSSEDRSRFESGKAVDTFAQAGDEEPSQQVLLLLSHPSATIDDPEFTAAIADATQRLTDAGIMDVVPPSLAPPEAGLVSPDRTTVRIVGRMFGRDDELDEKLAPVPALVEALRADYPDLRVHVLNNTLANEDIARLVNEDLDGSLRLTIPLTFLILLIAFGAIVAAIVPLVLAVTSLLAAFGILALYSQIVSLVSPYATQLIVLIGLAVAVDYSLFMITRFRSERRRGRDKLDAIDVASATAGRAVFFSGLAVAISIAGLLTLDDELFRSMALGTIAVVVVAVIGSLTFLPATLAILGRGVDALRLPLPGRDREEGSGFWSVIVRGAMSRAIVSTVLVAAVLVAIASPVGRLHIGRTDFTAFPDTIDAVRAVDLMSEKWPEGSTLELQLVVTRANESGTQAAIEAFSADVDALEGISGRAATRLSGDGTVANVGYVMSGTQNDTANLDLVRVVRRDLVPRHFAAVPGVEAYIGGPAAATLDSVSYYSSGLPIVIGFVLGLSFLLLLVAFRSIVIPIKAILLNLLSTGAAYGLLVLVFQEGHGSDLLGFRPGVIEAFVPIFIFTILFGLSMDYHVFILTRIKEARDRGLDSNRATETGISITSGTITSAAAIMVVVFAVFVTLQLVIVRQLGLGLAVAVLLDATIVRSVLLPATMRLLGEWNWWLPRWLGWIPRVTIEGPSEEPVSAPPPSDPTARIRAWMDAWSVARFAATPPPSGSPLSAPPLFAQPLAALSPTQPGSYSDPPPWPHTAHHPPPAASRPRTLPD